MMKITSPSISCKDGLLATMSHILPEKLFHSVSLTGSSVNFFHSQHFNYVLLIFLAYMVLKRKARCNFCLFFPFWFLFGIFSLTLIFLTWKSMFRCCFSVIYPTCNSLSSRRPATGKGNSLQNAVPKVAFKLQGCDHAFSQKHHLLHSQGLASKLGGGQGFPGHCLIKNNNNKNQGGSAS